MIGRHPLSGRRRHPATTPQPQSSWPSLWAPHLPSLSSLSSSSWFNVSAPLNRRASSTVSRRMSPPPPPLPPPPPPPPAGARRASEARCRPGASTPSGQTTPSPVKLPSTTSRRNTVEKFVAKLFRDKFDRIVWFADTIPKLIAFIT